MNKLQNDKWLINWRWLDPIDWINNRKNNGTRKKEPGTKYNQEIDNEHCNPQKMCIRDRLKVIKISLLMKLNQLTTVETDL